MRSDFYDIIHGPNVTSLKILKTRINQFLCLQNRNDLVWYPDYQEGFRFHDGSHTIAVLFGDFLRRFFESGNWLFENYTIYVLCTSSKEVLCKLCNFSHDRIGIIPRYQLFPAAPSYIPKPNQEINFVYAGRISATKNIKGLILLVHELQVTHNLNIRLNLFGEFDNQFHEELGPRLHVNYQDEILELCEEIEFVYPPIFHGFVAVETWSSFELTQPIFISLSTFIMEDFGVAAAQAQSSGWPCILSGWGGHKDVSTGHRILIDTCMIPTSHEPLTVQKYKATHLADFLCTKLKKYDWLVDSPTPKSDFTPHTISLDQINQNRRTICRSIGPDISYIQSHSLKVFAATDSGLLFLFKYRQSFWQNPKSLNVVIYYGLDDVFFKEKSSKLSNCNLDNKETIFISSQFFMAQMNIEFLLLAKSIYLLFNKDKDVRLFKYLSSVIPAEEITIL